AKSDPLDLTIELTRGASVSGRITTRGGQPVGHVLLVTKLNMHPGELTWRGFPLEALGSRFELSGLAEGAEYPVHFLDAENRLGATALLKAADKSPTVVLEPCGEAMAKFVDTTGKPVAGYRPYLEIVVTPGTSRLDLKVMRTGLQAAEVAYMA